MALNTMLIFLGFISAILIIASIETSSVPFVQQSEKPGRTPSGFRRDNILPNSENEDSPSLVKLFNRMDPVYSEEHLSNDNEKAQNMSDGSIQIPVQEFDSPNTDDFYGDESFLLPNEDRMRKTMAELGSLDKSQAKVTLSHPRLIVKVCAQLSRDIAWSMFKENYSRVNPHMSEEAMDKYRAKLQNGPQAIFDEFEF